MNLADIICNWLWADMITGGKAVIYFLNCTHHLYKGSNERYTISKAISIIQCQGFGEIMLGYQPMHSLQILYILSVWHISGPWADFTKFPSSGEIREKSSSGKSAAAVGQ